MKFVLAAFIALSLGTGTAYATKDCTPQKPPEKPPVTTTTTPTTTTPATPPPAPPVTTTTVPVPRPPIVPTPKATYTIKINVSCIKGTSNIKVTQIQNVKKITYYYKGHLIGKGKKLVIKATKGEVKQIEIRITGTNGTVTKKKFNVILCKNVQPKFTG